MIAVRGPDGTVIQFPDGTAPATIHSVMLAHHDAAQTNAQWQSLHTPGEAAVENGLLFNHGADGAGFEAAVKTGLANLVGRGPGYGMAQAFNANKQTQQQMLNQYQAQHPAKSLVANIAGSMINPVSVAGGDFVGGAASLPAAIGRGALVGGAEGGVANGPSGAATGAVIGGALPVGGAAVSKAAQTAQGVVNNVRRIAGALPPSVTAGQRLAAGISKDVKAGVDPRANLASWPGNSTPTLADVAGENTRAVIRDAGTKGPARQTLAAYRDNVAANLQDHAIALTGKLTPGEVRSGPAYAAAIRQQQGNAADTMYPAFKDDQIQVTPSLISAFSGTAGTKALSTAQTLADAIRDHATLGELNSIQLEQPPAMVSAGALDLARRGLRDSATAAYQAGDGTLGGGLKDRASDIEQALMASPGFDAARKTFADYAGQIDAIDHGGTVLNAPPSIYSGLLDGTNDGAMRAAQVGARQALVDAIGRPTEGAVGTLNRISTATNPTQNLVSTFGQDAADAYQNGIGAEVGRMSNANYMAPNLGSKTFSAGEDAKGFGHGIGGFVVGLAKQAVGGMPLTDAERDAIVTPGTGDLSDTLLQALLKAKAAQGALPGTGYAIAPALQLTNGSGGQ